MSTIKVAGLGGLGEDGKNMYLVEVDDQIFILDAGLKLPEIDLYGVDAVIPDISYLLANKERIAGIIISHGHEDHIGALPYLLENINVRVYGTHFTICMIEALLQERKMDISAFKLFRINENKTLKFGNVEVMFFNTTHTIPESVGIAIVTADGTIIYAPDFILFPNTDNRYRTSYDKLIDYAKKGTLLLMPESIGAESTERNPHNLVFEHEYRNILLNAKGRIFVSVFSNDLSRIQLIVNWSVEIGKKIAFINRQNLKMLDIAMNSGYLKVPENALVDLKTMQPVDDLVVIVAGTSATPFTTFNYLARDDAKPIKVTSNDHVVFAANPISGTEKIANDVLDVLYQKDISVTVIDKNKMRSNHATPEDLALLYSMVKPKYIMPVIGEYRQLYAHHQIAKRNGYDEDHIIDIEDGQVAYFVDGKFDGYEKIATGDIYVDGTLTGDVNATLINERIGLAEEGAIIVTLSLSVKNKKLLTEPIVITKGFVSPIKEEEFSKQVKELSTRLVASAFNKKSFVIDDLKTAIIEEITKITYRYAKKKPSILPLIIIPTEQNTPVVKHNHYPPKKKKTPQKAV